MDYNENCFFKLINLGKRQVSFFLLPCCPEDEGGRMAEGTGKPLRPILPPFPGPGRLLKLTLSSKAPIPHSP